MSTDLALVTGGAAGLGRFVVDELSARGYAVVVADRDASAAEATAAVVRARGGIAYAVTTDASDAGSVRACVARAAELGPIRVLVNNAGGWLPGPQFPDGDAWRRSIDLNLVMPMLATQLCLPLMVDGGAVVNVSSSGGTGSTAYGSPEYGAAKAGLIRFTTAVSELAAGHGVRVSCVVPHWIGLERARAAYAAMDPAERAASGGLVDPAVLAATIADLAEDPDSAGRVVVVRAGRAPYAIDPAVEGPEPGYGTAMT